jgi:ribonuclease P protein component
MLPKNRRISRKEFPLIMKNGRRFNSPHLLLYIYHDSQKNTELKSRFSFSISKKIMPKAVDRNTYRRRGYSVVSSTLPNVGPNKVCFFVYKKGAYPIIFSDLSKEVLGLLREAGVLI